MGITNGSGMNKLPDTKSSVLNRDELPDGTIFEYGAVTTTGGVDDVTAEVLVTYPDGSEEVFIVPVVFE